MEFRAGFRFVPSNENLVTYLTEKVFEDGGVRSDRVVLGECDMYGEKEPWNIWNDHGGLELNIKAGEDLYLFTKLKKVSVSGSRHHKRRVGSGTWSGAYCGEVAGGLAKKRHISYENEECSEHHLAWIMHEYSLVDPSAGYVLCRLRRRIKKNINEKHSKSVTIQTKNLALINDDQQNHQEIIKKQRLGVEFESHDDSSITIFQNLNSMEEQRYLPTNTNLITHYQKLSDDDQQVINYMQNNNMQGQVDSALNNNNIACIPTFNNMFDSDSHKELKEISSDDFINAAKSSTTTLGDLPDEQVVQEHSYGTCCSMDEKLLDDQKLLENFMEELPNILENIDHSNGAKPSSSTAGYYWDQIVSEDDDHAFKLLFENAEEELEKIMPLSYSPVNLFSEEVMYGMIMDIQGNNVAKSISSSSTTTTSDVEYLCIKSFAEQLKSVPLYYEAHDDHVLIDNLHIS